MPNAGEGYKDSLLSLALDCIIVADHEGKIVEFNPAAEQTFGYLRDQVLGKELAETIIPPAYRQKHRLGLARYLATGTGPLLGKRIELQALRADGSEFPVELAITATHKEGRPIFLAFLRDISEKIRAQESLQHSEAELRGLLTAMSDVILVLDKTGRYLKIAPTSPSLLYRPRAALIGRLLHEVLPADKADFFLECIQRALKLRQPVKLEYSLTIGASEAWFEGTVTPMSADAVIWVARDVTEQKRMEDSLRKSEERYRTLVEINPNSIFVNAGNKIVYDNPATLLLLGARSPQEILGQSPFKFIHKAFHASIRERVRSVLTTGVSAPRKEAKWLRLDGSPIDVEVTAHLLSWQGRPSIQVIARDITQRKRTEKSLEESLSLLHATLESTADGILVVDLYGKITSFNRKFASMWRIPSAILESRDDRRALEFALGQLQDPAGFLRKVKELYGRPEAESYDRLEFKDGRLFDRYSKPQRIGSLSVGRVWSFRDVTGHVLAEKALRGLSRHIVEAQEAERRRVARELHDGVNQILSAAKFRAGLLQPKSKSGSPRISKEVSRIRVLLENAIHEVRRISQNLRPMVLDDLGLVAAIRDTGLEFGRRTGQRVDLALARFPKRLPAGIELALYRIVQEALNNIEKHSRATRIKLSLARTGATITLAIQDNGRGFRLFTSGSPKRRPAGFGLDNMKERAGFVGGTLVVQSAPRKGTRVSVRIPAQRLWTTGITP